MFHGYIEHIAVKYPCFFLVFELQYQFINNAEGSHFESYEFAEHFVVVACDVIDFFAFADPVHDVFYDFHVTLRPVTLIELPDIDDIAVKYNSPGVNAFEIVKKLLGAAAVSAQMDIGDYYQIDFSLIAFIGRHEQRSNTHMNRMLS